MRAALAIGGKDLKERLRDRSAIILAILAPLGMAIVLNLTLGPVTQQSFHTTIAVVNADDGPAARGFEETLDRLAGDGVVTVKTVPDEAAARAAVAANEASAAYLIPEGFSAAVASDDPASFTVLTDPDQPVGGTVARSIAEGFAARLDAVRLSVATAAALGADDPGGLSASAASAPAPITLGPGQTESGGFSYATFYAQGITVFFLFFTVQFGVLSLIEERETGTMMRLAAAPIAPSSIVVGKLLASFVVGFVSAVVLWVATSLIMGAAWGSALGVVALIAAGIVAAVGLTAAVAGFARTAGQAGSITALIVVVLGILGGTFFPIARVSGMLAAVSRLTPHFWLMEGFGRLSAGESLAGVLPAIGAVLAFGVVFGTIGLVRSRSLVRYR